MNNHRDLYIEGRNVVQVVKALSSNVRMKILDLLDEQELNIQTLSKELNLGKTAILNHINILEAAGFITTRYIPGTVGNQKVCRKEYDRLLFDFSSHNKVGNNGDFVSVSTSVGNYFGFSVYPPCGLATKHKIIKSWDDPRVFFPGSEIRKVQLSLELSAQGELEHHSLLKLPDELMRARVSDKQSDITFWINGFEIGTVSVTDKARGIGAKYTPTWWKGSGSGELIKISIEKNVTDIDGESQTEFPTEIIKSDELSLRIGIKPDSSHIGGINLFGQDFGNFPQNIETRIFL